jgi:hypothetical protein
VTLFVRKRKKLKVGWGDLFRTKKKISEERDERSGGVEREPTGPVSE